MIELVSGWFRCDTGSAVDSAVTWFQEIFSSNIRIFFRVRDNSFKKVG